MRLTSKDADVYGSPTSYNDLTAACSCDALQFSVGTLTLNLHPPRETTLCQFASPQPKKVEKLWSKISCMLELNDFP